MTASSSSYRHQLGGVRPPLIGIVAQQGNQKQCSKQSTTPKTLPVRLRGGDVEAFGQLDNDDEASSSRNKLELSFEELSESQQVITSLQVNSKTVPSASFNKKRQLLAPTAAKQLQTGNAAGEYSGSTTAATNSAGEQVVVQVGGEQLANSDHHDDQAQNELVKRRKRRVLDPAGSLYYHWSAVVSFAFLYNFWSLSYRFAFREIDFDSMAFWFALDYSADLVYILDVIVNHRTGYLEDGVLEKNLDKIGGYYRDSTLFYLDCLCLLPLDFCYLSIGFNSILRCTRLVKIYKFWSYVDRTERHTNYPNVFRTFTLVHYILVIFHWNACLFHMISKKKLIDIEGLYKINDNQCIDILCQYLHAFYWSTLALTTIGDLPRPRTKGEYVYVTVELFIGLFIFATVLGHVANIVTNVSAARKEFQAKLDAVKTFMRMRRVSDELQNKVIRWFDYLWISQQSSDEERSVACLPDRLKAEIAIHVHLDTLKRVDIFQNTEAGFLCELVLRLKPVLFSPGDYVCRKNEVGHEMYIVSRGILEVVTNEGATVVATLKAGSYFGEISVLNVGLAGNKRTASVRSVGYSDLFCLNKQDLWDVLKNYPNAEARIRARAEERLSKLDINSASSPPPPLGPPSSQSGSHLAALDRSRHPAGPFAGNAFFGSHSRRLCTASGLRHKPARHPTGGLPQPGCCQQLACPPEAPPSGCWCPANARHLADPARRDGSAAARHQQQQQHRARRHPAQAAHRQLGGSLLASSNNLAPPNVEQRAGSLAGSHSRSLDQTTPTSANNNTATSKGNQLDNKSQCNQSREEEPDERHLAGGSTSRDSSRDESPGGAMEIERPTCLIPGDLFGGRSERSQVAALKRIGSLDEIGAFRRKPKRNHHHDDDDGQRTDAELEPESCFAARPIDGARGARMQHLSSGSIDSNNMTTTSALYAPRPAPPGSCFYHTNCPSALVPPPAGSWRGRRRRHDGSVKSRRRHHCCAATDEHLEPGRRTSARRYYPAQTAFWLAGGHQPVIQVPVLAAQVADGRYHMLQPVLASAQQSVSMSQLDVQQQYQTRAKTHHQQPPVSELRAHESSHPALVSGAEPTSSSMPDEPAGTMTSERPHPSLQTAQSGNPLKRSEAVVIDTEES